MEKVSIKASVQEMIDNLQSSLKDADKFDKGNSAAGTRVRKVMLETHARAKSVRALVSSVKSDKQREKNS